MELKKANWNYGGKAPGEKSAKNYRKITEKRAKNERKIYRFISSLINYFNKLSIVKKIYRKTKNYS
jgi:hypothetical protein